MEDEKIIRPCFQEKCNPCFWKKEGPCMLFGSQIELCLGPFKDQEDRIAKSRAEMENERESKPQPEVKRFIRNQKIENYWINRMEFDLKKDKVNEDKK